VTTALKSSQIREQASASHQGLWLNNSAHGSNGQNREFTRPVLRPSPKQPLDTKYSNGRGKGVILSISHRLEVLRAIFIPVAGRSGQKPITCRSVILPSVSGAQ